MSDYSEIPGRPIEAARLAVLRELRACGGVATTQVLISKTGCRPEVLSEALKQLEDDHWVQWERAAGRGVWRMTPQRRAAKVRRE